MNIESFRKRYLKFCICIFCLILFFIFMVCILKEIELKTDYFGYNIVSNYLINDNRTSFVMIITSFGSALCLVILTILSFFVFKKKKISVLITINLVTITICNVLIKNIIGRDRPIDNRIIEESGYSFPSGHSMVSMAFYGYFIYLIYRYVKNKKIKWILIILLGVLTLCIGISRIYLGVHYTSDVVSGFLFSIAYLILFISLTNKYLEK